MIPQDHLQSRIRPSSGYWEVPTYLSFSKEHSQPFCGNAEGWGPISKYRYDLTPCFLDIWISVVAVLGGVCGFGALYYLFRKCRPQPVHKDWHFYTKLVRWTAHTLSLFQLNCSSRLFSPSSVRLLSLKQHFKSKHYLMFGSETSASGPRSSLSHRFSSFQAYSMSSIGGPGRLMALYSSTGCSSSSFTP